jgi:drug/metabolite transporter (DMT)-like permease
MRKYSPWTVLFYAMLFGALTWNILYPPLEGFRHVWSPVVWGWVMFIGILGTLIPFGLYLEGINLIRATRASITATLEPITAGVLSFLFLNEILEFWQVMGAVLVIFSVVMLQLNQERDEKAPAIMRTHQNTRQP